MTIKRKRIYEIIIIGLVIILTSLCAYMGITAIQKSMKLNLSFTASPVVYCQMKIGEELVFDNLSSQIGDGVENLSGNTLTFNQDKLASTIGVESFSLTLKNHNKTGSSILVEFENATISGKTGYSEIIASGNSSTFAVTPLNLVGISMTKVTPVTVTFSLGDGVTLTSNILTSTSGEQCLPFGEDLEATISLEANYENPKFTLNGHTYEIANNQLTIPAEDLTGGDVSVEVEAEQQGYTITFNANGGKFADSSTTYSEIVTAGANYSLPTAPTKDGYSFLGWAESYSATQATWTAEEQTANKATTWYAVWGSATPVLTINWSGTPYNNSDSRRTLYMSIAYSADLTSSSISYPSNTDYMASITGEYTDYSMSSTGNQTQTKLEIEKNMGVIVYASAANNGESGPGLKITINSKSGISTYNEIKPYSSTLNAIFFTMPDDDVTLDITATKYGDWCFVAGTKVYTETGYKNIEDIKTGDMVWTLNEETNQFELKEVLYPTRNYYTDEVATIVVGGQEITATSGHTFLTKNRGWVAIKYLTQDDILWGFEQDSQITSISVSTYEGYVYNLHLQDNHNYMVGCDKIIVHNVFVPCIL